MTPGISGSMPQVMAKAEAVGEAALAALRCPSAQPDMADVAILGVREGEGLAYLKERTAASVRT